MKPNDVPVMANVLGLNGRDNGIVERPNAQVEIFEKVTEQIYNKVDIELKTELNDRQILAFASAKSFSEKFNIPVISEIVDSISVYSVSRSRKGRKEFENIAKANLGMHNEDEGRSIPDRLLGRR